MMTREEVAEIIMYCKEHKVTYKSRLAELNIPVWRFYDSKSRYAEEQSCVNTSKGDFIELGQSGTFIPVPSFTGQSGRKPKRSEEHTSELQSRQYLVCRLLLEKKKKKDKIHATKLQKYNIINGFTSHANIPLIKSTTYIIL